MAIPPILILLGIIALVLHIVFGYLWRKQTDPPSLILAIVLILVIVLMWFLPWRVA